jgi:hypothetical protein
MMMWYGNNGWGWLHWTAMTVGMVAFWALVITAVVLAVHYLTSQNGTWANPPTRGKPTPRICSLNASHAVRLTTTNIEIASHSCKNTASRMSGRNASSLQTTSQAPMSLVV